MEQSQRQNEQHGTMRAEAPRHSSQERRQSTNTPNSNSSDLHVPVTSLGSRPTFYSMKYVNLENSRTFFLCLFLFVSGGKHPDTPKGRSSTN